MKNIIPTQQKGFILVTLLWVLTVVTLLVSFFALWTERAVSIVQTMQTDLQGEIDSQSTQATLLYLFSTQPFTVGGVTTTQLITDEKILYETEGLLYFLPTGSEVALDGRVYQGLGTSRFSLQDEGGLLNLNLLISLETPNNTVERRLKRLLGELGVAAEHHDSLVAKLQDYIDADNAHRVNGAETYHYEQRNLPPPANHGLLNSMECLRVLDWEEQAGLIANGGRWGQVTTTALAGDLNLNTAPLEVLKTVDNMNLAAAEQWINLRKQSPAWSISGLSQLLGVYLGNDDELDAGITFYPSRFIRIAVWHETARTFRETHIELTPLADGLAPWIVDSTHTAPLRQEHLQSTPLNSRFRLFPPADATTTPEDNQQPDSP